MRKSQETRPKRLLQFVFEDPEKGLREIVTALNKGTGFDTAAHTKLLRLVRAWKESGPNLFKMKARQDDDATVPEMWKAWKVGIAPRFDGGAYLYPSPTGQKSKDKAAIFFIRLILNPACLKLGGPCLNCDQWYLKKTFRPSIYCSRTCAQNATKVKERSKKKDDKLRGAMLAIKHYKSSPLYWKKYSWKEYVSQAISVNRKWVTRQVNLGHLVAPLTTKKAKRVMK